jgi:hypothetical protein
MSGLSISSGAGSDGESRAPITVPIDCQPAGFYASLFFSEACLDLIPNLLLHAMATSSICTRWPSTPNFPALSRSQVFQLSNAPNRPPSGRDGVPVIDVMTLRRAGPGQFIGREFTVDYPSHPPAGPCTRCAEGRVFSNSLRAAKSRSPSACGLYGQICEKDGGDPCCCCAGRMGQEPSNPSQEGPVAGPNSADVARCLRKMRRAEKGRRP